MDVSVKLKPKTDDLAVNNNQMNEKKEDMEGSSKKFETLGLIVSDLTESAKKLNEVEFGVLVKDVAHFSEAFNRGLRSGFVIIEADKRQVKNISDLDNILSGKSKGDVIVFKVATQNKDIRLVALEIQ